MKLKEDCPKPESQKNNNFIWRTTVDAFNDYAAHGLELLRIGKLGNEIYLIKFKLI